MQKYTTIQIALTGVIAALYTAITYVLQPISFLAIQVRVSGALILLLPLFPEATLLGVSLGVLFANMTSPLGPIDLLSAPITLLAMIPLYLLRKKGIAAILAGGAIKSIVIAIWVSAMLQWAFGAPMALNFPLVLIGDLIAVIGLGSVLYVVLKRALPASLSIKAESNRENENPKTS
jgi:uncharacterized membrane protein